MFTASAAAWSGIGDEAIDGIGRSRRRPEDVNALQVVIAVSERAASRS